MPWHIRKRPPLRCSGARCPAKGIRPNYPNQAKVYSQDGTPLSNKWLTLKQAEKQLVAVRIVYNKSKK